MTLFCRLACRLRRFLFAPVEPVQRPELWCRPATVLALRDRGRAAACLAGWR